jgi:hypothetical protein
MWSRSYLGDPHVAAGRQPAEPLLDRREWLGAVVGARNAGPALHRVEVQVHVDLRSTSRPLRRDARPTGRLGGAGVLRHHVGLRGGVQVQGVLRVGEDTDRFRPAHLLGVGVPQPRELRRHAPHSSIERSRVHAGRHRGDAARAGAGQVGGLVVDPHAAPLGGGLGPLARHLRVVALHSGSRRAQDAPQRDPPGEGCQVPTQDAAPLEPARPGAQHRVDRTDDTFGPVQVSPMGDGSELPRRRLLGRRPLGADALHRCGGVEPEDVRGLPVDQSGQRL